MKKIIAAASAAACMTVLLTGCGGASYKSDTKTSYQSEFYSFSVSDDYELTNSYTSDGEEFPYCFIWEGKGLYELEISSRVKHCTAELSADELVETLDSMDSVEDIETETLSGYAFPVYAVHYTDTDAEREQRCTSVYELNYQDRNFELSVDYSKLQRSKVKAVMEDILSTVEYTSDYALPTIPQTITDDYFTVDYDPYWVGEYSDSADNGTKRSVLFQHAAAETFGTRHSQLTLSVISDGDYDSAAEFADNTYERYSDSSIYTSAERDTVEIAGHTAEFVSGIISADLGGKYMTRVNSYWIDLNDVIYSIRELVNCKEESEIGPELDKLIAGIHFNELSDEQRESLNAANESAKQKHISFYGMEFDIDRRFTVSEYDTYVSLDKSPLDIDIYYNDIYFSDYDSVKDYADDRAELPHGGEIIGRESITVGGRDAELIRIDYSSSGYEAPPFKDSYYIFCGDGIIRIDNSYSEENSDEANEAIREILDTVTFSDTTE